MARHNQRCANNALAIRAVHAPLAGLLLEEPLHAGRTPHPSVWRSRFGVARGPLGVAAGFITGILVSVVMDLLLPVIMDAIKGLIKWLFEMIPKEVFAALIPPSIRLRAARESDRRRQQDHRNGRDPETMKRVNYYTQKYLKWMSENPSPAME